MNSQSLCFGWVLLFRLSSLPQDGMWRGQQDLTLEESSVSPDPERRRASSVESTFFRTCLRAAVLMVFIFLPVAW